MQQASSFQPQSHVLACSEPWVYLHNCQGEKWQRAHVHACAAAIAYEVLSGQALLPVDFDLADYNGRLAALQQAPMPGAPPALLPALRAMLAHSPPLRPPAISFTAAGYFQAGASSTTSLPQEEILNSLTTL
jgi:hypothetical protein